MRIGVQIIGDLAEAMRQEYLAGERAVTRTMAKAAAGVKNDWREEVERAGLGRKLRGTIRSKVYPEGTMSMNAAAVIWTKAPKIVGAFEQGVTIRSKSGFFLAIPTDAAGRGPGRRRLTPGEWEQRRGERLRFVYRRNAPSLLVADNMRARTGRRGGFSPASQTARRTGRGLSTVPIFVLVPQVRLRKRLDLERSVRRWERRIPGEDRERMERGGIMSDSTREAVLKALLANITAAVPSGAVVLREAPLPERVPDAGLLILRDGTPGDPEATMSPLMYHFEHEAEIEVFVKGADAATRATRLDALLQTIGTGIEDDRTLGGTCDWADPGAAAPTDLPIDGADGIKAVMIPVLLHYATSNPLT